MSDQATKQRTDEAVIRQWAYKPGAMREMVVHVLSLALRGGEFSANDLPIHGEEEHGGSGIAGSVILQLKRDGILAEVGTFDGPTFCPRIVRNAGGNKIGLYRIGKPGLARTLLERHTATSGGKQEQLGLFGTVEPA